MWIIYIWALEIEIVVCLILRILHEPNEFKTKDNEEFESLMHLAYGKCDVWNRPMKRWRIIKRGLSLLAWKKILTRGRWAPLSPSPNTPLSSHNSPPTEKYAADQKLRLSPIIFEIRAPKEANKAIDIFNQVPDFKMWC